jgi:hypothetical protein
VGGSPRVPARLQRPFALAVSDVTRGVVLERGRPSFEAPSWNVPCQRHPALRRGLFVHTTRRSCMTPVSRRGPLPARAFRASIRFQPSVFDPEGRAPREVETGASSVLARTFEGQLLAFLQSMRIASTPHDLASPWTSRRRRGGSGPSPSSPRGRFPRLRGLCDLHPAWRAER